MSENTNYIFPKKVADRMAMVNQKTQYEAQMFGTAFLMIGIILSGIYFFFYFDFALWYKVVLVLNLFAGLIVMGTSIITTYQQYLAYMAAIELQKVLNPELDQLPQITATKARVIRYLSGAIMCFTGAGILIFLEQYKVDNYLLWAGVTLGVFSILYGGITILNTSEFIKKNAYNNTTIKEVTW